MLIGQDFGGCHHARLVVIVERNEHTHQRHQRLSATHIALQQTIHLATRAHVATYLLQHTLLCIGQLERQILLIKAVEHIAHLRKEITAILTLAVFGIAKNVQLDIEKFFKLQAILRLTQLVGILRKMNGTQRIR